MSIKKRRWAAGVLVLSIVGGLLASVMLNHGADSEWPRLKRKIRTLFPSVRHLSIAELDMWLNDTNREPPLLLDSRDLEEYKVSHLPGAIHAGPETDFNKILPEPESKRPIVIYCSVGYRSSVMAKELQANGYTNVYNLEGSIFEWANTGRSVYCGREEVQVVHPYDEEWGLFLNPELHPRAN